MMHITRSFLAWMSRLSGVCVGVMLAASANAEMVVNYPRHETGATLHTAFYFQVLQEALERTRDEFGPFTLQYTPQGMNPSRASAELTAGTIQVDVRSWTEERDRRLHRVPIPVDKGLIGYRVLLIRAEDQARFAAVRTLDDLAPFSFGLLESWGDVRIFEHNGLRVVKSSSYKGIFRMLSAGRFDALSRDIDEVQFELERVSQDVPSLAIESTLLLRYPSARYFYVNRTLEGLKLAARIEIGLNQMQEDGRFDTLFRNFKDMQINRLGLRNRRIIDLVNPLLPAHASLTAFKRPILRD